jgi:hypothetical protein
MAILDPQIFRTNTAPGGMFKKYGKNMGLVLAALEAYWENQNGAQIMKEQLLYTLWKECNRWLKLKARKTDPSALSLRRKGQVESLRDEAFAKLVEVAPRVAHGLGHYQNKKQQNGPLQFGLKPLDGPYQREREYYVQNGKSSGSSVSQTGLDAVLQDEELLNRRNPNFNPKFAKYVRKGFGDLNLSDMVKVENMFPNFMPPVLYLNKAARMQYMVTVSDAGLLCDLDGNPIFMDRMNFGAYYLAMYAMDKYGNLFVVGRQQRMNAAEYVERNGGTCQVKHTMQWNHSSFLAGADALCAGFIHIGYNCARRSVQAGWLSAIDNGSGHYKPNSEQLRNCLRALRDQGVQVETTRVCDLSTGDRVAYWGHDFLAGGQRPWPSPTQAPVGLLKAPPVAPY